MFCRPARHCLHSQHGRNGSSVTRCPTTIPDTADPTVSTVPQTSWPGAYGSSMNGCEPASACVSDPQTPATAVRTSTSPGPGTGTSAETTDTPSPETITRRITSRP